MSRQAALVVFLVALALRLVYLAAVFEGPDTLREPGSAAFEQAGQTLVATGAATGSGSKIAVAPGYPAWLALFYRTAGDNPLYPVLIQAALDALTCVLIGWLANAIQPRLALPAGLLATVNHNMIVHAALIGPASLFLFCLTAALAFAARYGRRPGFLPALGCGLGFGVAWQIDPAIEFFFPVLLIALAVAAWRGRAGVARGSLQLAIVASVALACVAPFYIVNYNQSGYLRMSSQDGDFAFGRVAPLVLEYGVGLPPAEALNDLEERLADRLAAEGLTALPADPLAASALKFSVAADTLAELGPGVAARAWAAGIAFNLLAPAVLASPPMRGVGRPHLARTPGVNPAHKAWAYLSADAGFAAIVIPALVLVVLARFLAMLALLMVGRALATGPVLLLLALAVYVLLRAGPVADLTLRLPLEPLFTVLLAATLVWVGDHWVQRATRPRGPGKSQT